jgi:hypothetical protein
MGYVNYSDDVVAVWVMSRVVDGKLVVVSYMVDVCSGVVLVKVYKDFDFKGMLFCESCDSVNYSELVLVIIGLGLTGLRIWSDAYLLPYGFRLRVTRAGFEWISD